ncbi:MAG TPA: PDZ domain-containing protein [Terriglobales bacterium]|nr:PDZ domain-containing protein [Terriglobales bacterium]
MSRRRTAGFAFFLLIFGILFLNSASAVTPVTCASPTNAAPEPTEYFVSLADHPAHLVHVSIRIRERESKHTLEMPVWNALYQVRNFAANLEHVRAQDASGAPAEVRNTKNSEWEVTAPPGCIVVSYDIHLDSPGPFGSALNADHGFFNWAMVFMYSPALRTQPVSLRLLDVPASWALRDVHVLGGAEPGKVSQEVGVARNYDELADSPAEVGPFRQSAFQEDGATYHVVVDGNSADYDMTKLQEVLRKITHAAVNWMQDRPYDEYTFLYHFPRGPGAGGMEHAYGAAIDINAERLRNDLSPVADVSAHEFFHLWNVKRIRPQSLQPIDYQRENDTRALWFSEGVTSTVGDILLARAGLIDEATYLQRIAAQITELQNRPAHTWQSAEESSLNAWFEGIAFYRSPERSISYYNKGDILGVLLDLRIRELTGGKKSLRDLFQWMNDHYARQHRFFPDSGGVEQAAEAITGQSFAGFFRDYVAGVKEIPYDEYFRFAGLRLVARTIEIATPGFTTTANLGGQPEVLSVEPNSEAQRAGIVAGDRITAVNGAPADSFLDDALSRMRRGTTVRLQIENRRGKREVSLRLGSREEQIYGFQDLTAVTPEQRAHRAAWIRGDDESGGAP